jgi:hypothetical protein
MIRSQPVLTLAFHHGKDGRLLRTLALLLAVPVALLTACGNSDGEDPTATALAAPVVLLRWNESLEPGVMLPTNDAGNVVELRGTFVIENGCMRIAWSEAGPNTLLIWPPGYGLSSSEAGVIVENDSGAIVAAEGESLTVRGHVITTLDGILELFNEPVAQQCAVPVNYMLVGEVPA